MNNKPSTFYRFFDRLDDRLDENFNNPIFDELKTIINTTKFEIFSIGAIEIKKDILSGTTPKNLQQSPDLDIPFIGSTSIRDEKVDLNNAPRITREIHETKLKNSQLKKGDILITMAGTIGRCAIFDSDEECNANQAVAILRIHDGKIMPMFLLKYLNSRIGQLYFGKLQHMAGQPNINLEEIESIDIIIPSKNQQKLILSKLTPFEVSSQRKKHEAQLELDKIESLFSEKFGICFDHLQIQNYNCSFDNSLERLDFIFNDPFYSKYEELMNKSKVPFIELGISGLQFTTETTNPLKRPDESFLYVDIGSIDTMWGKMYPESMLGSEAISSRIRKVMRTGEVLVSTTRPTRNAIAIVPNELDGQICSTGFSSLRCPDSINNEYLFHILRSKITTEQFFRYCSGSGYPEINKRKDLPKIKIPIPDSLDTQVEIVNKINLILKTAKNLYDESLIEKEKALKIFEDYIYKPISNLMLVEPKTL